MHDKLKAALLNRESFATTLLVAASDLFGPDLVSWDPTTVRMELESELGRDVPEANYNRLMAAIQLVTTDAFYQSLPDFITLCNILDHGMVDLDTFDPADAGEIAWGITEALLIWPPDAQEENPFSDTLVQYIALALQDEGILNPPDVLRLGGVNQQDLLEKVQYNFSDDPLMFSAIHDLESAKTGEINQQVQSRLHLLIRQLEEIPLRNGSAADIAKKLLSGLRSLAVQDRQLPSASA